MMHRPIAILAILGILYGLSAALHAQTAPLTCNPQSLIGTWFGKAGLPGIDDPRIVFGFTFSRAGEYGFSVSQGTANWSSHVGRFTIGPETAAGKYSCLITFRATPESVTTNAAAQKANKLPPGIRDLTNSAPTFRARRTPEGILMVDSSLGGPNSDVGSFLLEYQGR